MTALVLSGLVLALAWGLWTIRPVLAPFLLAVVLAYLLAPLVNGLVGLGLPRGWAILAVYAALAAAGILVVVKLVPSALTEVRRLTETIPLYSARARDLADGLQRWARDAGLPPELRESLDRSITNIEVRSVAALRRLLDIQTLEAAAGFLVSLLLSPFLAFYLLKDLDYFRDRFLRALPRRWRQDIIQLLRELDRVISGFVRGQVLLGLSVGALAAVASSLLGLRFAVLLGIWAGLTEFIPYVGPVLGAVPAVLSGLAQSPWRGMQVALVFLLIQQVESAVLSPKIMGHSVGLHPIGVLFVVLAGGYLAGPWGMILAVPAAGLLRVLWAFVVARLTEVHPLPVLPAPAARPEPVGPEGPERWERPEEEKDPAG